MYACMVFIDVSKAFDKVWHNGLIFKLKQFGISDILLSWFSSYLENRIQRVVLDGKAYQWERLHAGVPQGFVFGPLLFLIFINDLVDTFETLTLTLYSSSTSYVEYQAGGGKGLVDLVNQLTLERCHSF